jgi:subtilisin family serine protease
VLGDHCVLQSRQNGRSSSTQIQAGIDWLRTHHPEVRIANVSLAGDIPLSGNCSALTPDGLPAPACFPATIAVGAVYARTWGAVTAPDVCRDAHPIADEVACWSNARSQLDLLAPGAPIETTGLGGATATFAGTSAASAVAAGGAALLLQASPGPDRRRPRSAARADRRAAVRPTAPGTDLARRPRVGA